MKHPRNLVGACLSAALLAACGGGSPSMSTPAAVLRHSSSESETFKYIGRKQTFVVPSYVTAVTITAAGASGGGSGYTYGRYYYGPGGVGGWVQATIPVTPGEKLVVSVGGSGAVGGFNGAGAGGFTGGGASDIRQGGKRLKDRVVVAAGGGGEGSQGCVDYSKNRYYCVYGSGGGEGGGATGRGGQTGSSSYDLNGTGGSGGSTHRGGRGGSGGGSVGNDSGSSCDGNSGGRGQSGSGGGGGSGCYGAGGGGGGGYYGGGGGGGAGFASDCYYYYYTYDCNDYLGEAGGGGGGSSYAEASATNVTDTAGGAPRGDGQIVISW